MPWIIKGLLLVAKSRRGRELLFAVGLTAVEIARSERARALYGRTRRAVTDPALREAMLKRTRNVTQRLSS